MSRYFRALRNAFIRECGRFATSCIYRLVGLWLPLVSFVFFAAFFSKGEMRNLPVAIIDEDSTPLSRRAVAMLDATEEIAVLCELQSRDEAEQMLRQGDIYAVIFLPRNFENDILALRGSTVELYNSGVNISANGLVSRGATMAVRTLSAGTTIAIAERSGASIEAAMALAQPIALSQHALFNPWLNYGYYLAGGFMSMMLVIFCVVATIYALGSELRDATAVEWFNSSGGSLSAAIVGKLSFVSLLMCCIAAVMLATMFYIVGVPLQGSAWMVVAATAVLIFSYEAVAFTTLVATANMRLALSLGGGYSVLAFTFSGITFPTMAMYDSVAWLSPLFPYTHYMRLVIDQTMRGASADISLPQIAYMALFWLLPIAVMGRSATIFRNSKYTKRL